MADKIAITPKLLREAGFREVHFPGTAFKFAIDVNRDTTIDINITPDRHDGTYILSVYEYFKGGLEDRCRFSGLSITSEINSVLKQFRHSDCLPQLPTDSQ